MFTIERDDQGYSVWVTDDAVVVQIIGNVPTRVKEFRLTKYQVQALARELDKLASKIPLMRVELIRPIYDSLAGIQLNQREADHLIERIKSRVRE